MGGMESRISAARARANRANNVILAAAVALFVAAVGVARIAHPARASQPATSSRSSTASSSTSSSDQVYDESGDDGYYGSGSIAPSQSTPQLSTGGS
jgi:uncharacterized protein with FMN-binding domain